MFSKRYKYQCFFEEVAQKHYNKHTISDMLCCESVANSGVFVALAFLLVAKTL